MQLVQDASRSWAFELADSLIGFLHPRWEHVRAVARLAEAVSRSLDQDPDVLVPAALLHDIGYGEAIARTGFHPLDGARFLREMGHDDVASLVAHHSGARHEARLRGLDDFEEEFPYEDSAVGQALTFCDMTTSPWGRRVRIEDRIAEIASRYGRGHTTTTAIEGCADELKRAVAMTERRLSAAGVVLIGSLGYPD